MELGPKTIRLGVIGCGGVAAIGHLPAAVASPRCRVTALVDANRERAQALAEKFQVPRVETDFRAVLDEVDAAIVAVPHSLHVSLGSALLAAGKHVLLEKPLATTAAECDQLIAAAGASHATLCVGLMRRYLRHVPVVTRLLQTRAFGPLVSFDVQEGNVYDWPVQSDSFWRRETAGGGVLLDTGAHTLDLLLQWLGEVELLSYRDDQYGGVEADCQMELATPAGARGQVRLSRSANLRNSAILRCEDGVIEADLRMNRLAITTPDGSRIVGGVSDAPSEWDLTPQGFIELFPLQLEAWLSALQAGGPPPVPASEAARSIRLIEACYRQRQPWELPWVHTGGEPVVEGGAR